MGRILHGRIVCVEVRKQSYMLVWTCNRRKFFLQFIPLQTGEVHRITTKFIYYIYRMFLSLQPDHDVSLIFQHV